MKKTYWNPLGVNHAKIVSRRFNHRSFATVAYKTDANGKEIPDEDDKRTEAELLVKIQEMVTRSLGGTATKEELQTIIEAQKKELAGINLVQLRAMADDATGVMSVLAKQGLEIERLRTATAAQKPGEDMSLRGQIKSWLESRSNSNDPNSPTIQSLITDIKTKKIRHQLPEMQLRVVASPMHVSTVNPTASPWIGRVEVESGITDFLRASPTFWDYLTKGRTNAQMYVWVNKTNPQGAAGWIGPGVAKPGVSFELIADNSFVKKIADSAKAGTELLDDIDGMATFIEQELRYQVMIKVNSQLMSGTASSTLPQGIQGLSVAYTTTTIKTRNPNHMDAIRAVIGQMRNGYIKGDITVFINPIDSANMELAKAVGSGNYLIPPFMSSNGKTIGGATIVEDQNVPIGYFQAAFLRFYRILIYQDFAVAWGWENDDFTKNLVTAVGEMRMHQFFNQAYTGAFVYDTFVNVEALIDQA